MANFNVLVSVEISDNLVGYMMEHLESSRKRYPLSDYLLYDLANDLNFDYHDAQLAHGQISGMKEELKLLKSLKKELNDLIFRVGGSTQVADLLAAR